MPAERERESRTVRPRIATAATTQLTSWMTVSVARKPSAEAKTTGSASIGGSQKSRVSAAIRASSISTSEMPSVAATIVLGELSASGANTARERMLLTRAA